MSGLEEGVAEGGDALRRFKEDAASFTRKVGRGSVLVDVRRRQSVLLFVRLQNQTWIAVYTKILLQCLANSYGQGMFLAVHL